MPEDYARKTVAWRAKHPARVFGPVAVLLVVAVALLNLAGCESDDPNRPEPDTTLAGTITITAEPDFTAGTTNTISWSVDDPVTKTIPDGWSFLAQRSTDAEFASDVNDSPWISGEQHTFAGLADAVTSYYRVKARDGEGRESEWSAAVSTIQDDLAPAAMVLALTEEQTSLLFNVEVTVDEATSGVEQVELWFSKNGGEMQLHGLVEPGVVSFQTDEGGPHAFIALATDRAGNIQSMPTEAQSGTLVPEPIILVDLRGYAWDITNAVLKHKIHLEWWDHGIGRFTIRPAIEPPMIGPNDVGWPGPDNIVDVIALDIGGDQRAYKIGDLAGREVADDVVNGVPIAATY